METTKQPYRQFCALGTSDNPSKLKSVDMARLRTEYRIPNSVGLILARTNERACYLRLGCVAIIEAVLRVGLRLPINPFFQFVLSSYKLALTQLNPNAWSQIVGS